VEAPANAQVARTTATDGALSALRIAFVGQGVYFRQCALEAPAGGLEPAFIDFRAGVPPEPLSERLHELDPDVVLVFRPEIIPAGLFDGLRALTLGYLTEPLPRSGAHEHPDLRARMWWLKRLDRGNFDRIVSFDPLIAETAASVVQVWRSLPIPVADSLYMDGRPRNQPPRLLFLGRSTPHREELLAPIKRAHPIVHIGHGLFDDQLRRLLRDTDVQLNLHNNPYPSFENRVCIALAAGHLVISEPLSPQHGLEPGVHHLEVRTPDELRGVVDRLAREPDAYAQVQAAGREQAERFRASLVYPQLVRDALADTEAAGSERRRA
jgi:glycosyl transferase family 1